MTPRLPLELQLHILELAIPPADYRNLDGRQELAAQLSLVHRSWTRAAQAQLFTPLTLLYNPGWYEEEDEVHTFMEERIDVATAITGAPVRSVCLLHTPEYDDDDEHQRRQLAQCVQMCPEIEEVFMVDGVGFVDLLAGLNRAYAPPLLLSARTDCTATDLRRLHLVAMRLDIAALAPLATRLTYLSLVHTGEFPGPGPPLPHLRTLLVSGCWITHLIRCLVLHPLFPALETFGWESSCGMDTLSLNTLPPTTRDILVYHRMTAMQVQWPVTWHALNLPANVRSFTFRVEVDWTAGGYHRTDRCDPMDEAQEWAKDACDRAGIAMDCERVFVPAPTEERPGFNLEEWESSLPA